MRTGTRKELVKCLTYFVFQGGLRNRKRDIQYAEVSVVPGQMFPVPPPRTGPNTNYTTIDVDLSRGLQQTRNEKAQETIDS